jgi:hypothetical protein
MLVAACFAGCSHAPELDARLCEADSLLHNQHELALMKLNDIQPETLPSKDDQIYHTLLQIQARYKCYEPIDADSTNIDKVINYYRSHKGTGDKLTRAYLMKGAIMQELEQPDSAMHYYKQAEFAAEGDEFNLGYAKLRIAKLYSKHHAYDGRDIEKIEQALDCFKRLNDTIYQIISLKELGSAYRPTKTDTSIVILQKAIGLAEQVKDTAMLLACTNDLAESYYNNSKYRGHSEDKNKALKQIKTIQALKTPAFNEEDCYITFAKVYALMGMPDSALKYINLIQLDDLDQNPAYLEAKAEIAHAQGDLQDELQQRYQQKKISDSLMADEEKLNIMHVEDSCEKMHDEQLINERNRHNNTLAAIVGAVIMSLIIFALYFYRRAHRYDNLVLELKDQSRNQITDLTELQHSINELKINDERLKMFISSNMGMMREMIEACYHEPNNRIAENMKRIVKFQDSNKDNWVKLYDYIDMEHNNIMTRTREQYPQLNDKDLMLLALTCMGYSYIQTAIIMGYSNATSVSVLKQRLAKKMGLDCTLNEYIENNGNMKN